MKAMQAWAGLLPVLVVALPLWAFAQAPAEKGKADVQTREGTGEVAIVRGNVDKAMEQAKERALRDAVEKAAGVMISSETITENGVIFSDQVFANSQGYVKSYDVVSKSQEGGVAKVVVKAVILTENLDRDLQAVQSLVRRIGRPRLAVVLQEQTIQLDQSVTTTKAMADELNKAFRQDGWTVLDEAAVQGVPVVSAAAGANGAAPKELSKLKDVDYVLYGTVLFRRQDASGPGAVLCGGKTGKDCAYFPVTGEYNFSVFATSTGTQVGTFTGKMSTGDLGKIPVISYEQAAYDLAKHRGKEIVAEVRKGVYGWLLKRQSEGDRVVMNVHGVKEYASVPLLVKVLKEQVPGVRGVDFRNYRDQKVELDVTYVGSTEKLAEAIDGAKFRGNRLSVSGRSANQLEVTVGK